MKQFKRSLLSVALASALQTVAAGAYADEADAAAAETPQGQQASKEDEAVRVEVTGIRAGIEKSIDTKRESTEIVESISAEDIGKLPDVSIAESIARLPGLTAQRVAGRASTVQIRGLADDFATATLNGREQVSTGQNRGVEFDQYPSELLSAVKVYKTPNAALIGQGLAGTVDLQTVSPLSYSERVVSLNGRIQRNSNDELNPGTDSDGNRLSLSYIDQFANNTIGLAIGFAHLDTPGQTKSWEGYSHGTVNVNGEDAFIIGASKAQALSSDNKRDGVMAVIEFKPNDSYRSTVDLYYSKFEQDETLRFIEAQLQAAGWAGTAVDPSSIEVQNGRVVSATFNNVFPIVRNDLNTREDKITAVGWKNELTFSDEWSGVLDLSFSKAEREEMILETYSGFGSRNDPANLQDVSYTLTDNDHPVFTYGRTYEDPSQLVLGDIGGWGQAGYVKYPSFDDELTSFKISARRTFADGIFSSLDLGVNHADREKSRGVGEQFLRLPNGPVALTDYPGALLGLVDLGMSGNSSMIAYDAGQALASGIYTLESNNTNGDVRNKQWTVNEKITTAYAQLNIDTELSSVPVRGNVGVQVVRVDQSSDGFTTNDGEEFSNGDTYTDTLPSLNLSAELVEDQLLRVGIARQMARPRMDDLRANIGVGINTGRNPPIWSGSGGNPTLKPWEADAYDLSYEIYFGGQGYLSLAYFYKDLKTYIYNQTIQYDFTGIDTSGYNQADLPPSFIGELTAPANGEGGTLKGWEAAVSVPFNLLSESLDGFGIMASYTDNDTSIQPDGPDSDPTPLPGFSEEVSNITVYYENAGFQARISQRSRSDFLGEVTGFGADRVRRYIEGEDIVDLQFGYSFAEGSSLEGMSLLLQVNNLTDEPYREYDPNNGDLPLKYQEYGKTILAGVNYKF